MFCLEEYIGDNNLPGEIKQEYEDDPYLRALEEHNRKKKEEKEGEGK